MYEYQTSFRSYSPENCSQQADQKLNAEGWIRVWADIDVSGIFLVFRRPRRSSSKWVRGEKI
jgi:hypothetical protein